MLCQPVADLFEFSSLEDLSLESTSLFGAMNPTQIETLWSLITIQTHASGAIIFEQGELPSSIYIVATGEVEFSIKQNTDYMCVDVLRSGDVLGETAVIGIQAQIGTARVSQTSEAKLLVLGRDALIQLQQRDIELFSLLMMNIARHVSRKYHDQLTPI